MLETETELIRRLRQGDPLAFHRLVDGYANRLYGLAYSLLGNAEDAEDVVQETLSGAFRGIGSFEQRSALWTWLVKILVRQVAKSRRSAGPLRMTPIQPLDDEMDGETGRQRSAHQQTSPAARVDAQVDVATALSGLAPEHRQIVVLRELQQMSYGEISQVLGIPMGTVESRLYRAREELRKLLRDWK